MAAYVVVCGVAVAVAAMTLFSGFGLGTLLMPAFAVFFPPEVAIAATAVVHLANNVFKLVLIGRWAKWRVVASFGVCSALGAFVGAWTLSKIALVHVLVTYGIAGHECRVTVAGLVIGALVVVFGLLEFSDRLSRVNWPPRLLPVGGVVSGFFGGLSGHQGALRSAFLLRAGMSKEELVGTRAACAVIVDTSRLIVYGLTFFARDWDVLRERGGVGLVAGACVAAFVGSAVGVRLVKSVTLEGLQKVVAVMLVVLGVALGAGVV